MTFDEKADIRRTIKIGRPVSGVDIIAALRQWASENEGYSYYQKPLYSIDGTKVYDVGLVYNVDTIELLAEKFHGDVVIRHGYDLSHRGIVPSRSYECFGIGSAVLLKHESMWDNDLVAQKVQEVQEGLEQILGALYAVPRPTPEQSVQEQVAA